MIETALRLKFYRGRLPISDDFHQAMQYVIRGQRGRENLFDQYNVMHDDWQTLFETIKAKTNEYMHHIDRANQTITQLRTALTETQIDNTNKDLRINEMQIKIDQLTAEVTTMRNRLVDDQQKITAVHTRCEETNAELNRQRSRAEDTRMKLADLHAENEDLVKKLALATQVSSTIEAMADALKRIELENGTLKINIEKIAEKVNGDVDAWQNDLAASLKASYDNQANNLTKITDAASKIDRSIAQINTLSAVIANLDATGNRLASIERTMANAHQAIADAAAHLKTLNVHVNTDRLEAKMDVQTTAITQRFMQLEAINAKVTQIEAMNTKFERIEAMMTDLPEKVRVLVDPTTKEMIDDIQNDVYNTEIPTIENVHASAGEDVEDIAYERQTKVFGDQANKLVSTLTSIVNKDEKPPYEQYHQIKDVVNTLGNNVMSQIDEFEGSPPIGHTTIVLKWMQSVELMTKICPDDEKREFCTILSKNGKKFKSFVEDHLKQIQLMPTLKNEREKSADAVKHITDTLVGMFELLDNMKGLELTDEVKTLNKFYGQFEKIFDATLEKFKMTASAFVDMEDEFKDRIAFIRSKAEVINKTPVLNKETILRAVLKELEDQGVECNHINTLDKWTKVVRGESELSHAIINMGIRLYDRIHARSEDYYNTILDITETKKSLIESRTAIEKRIESTMQNARLAPAEGQEDIDAVVLNSRKYELCNKPNEVKPIFDILKASAYTVAEMGNIYSKEMHTKNHRLLSWIGRVTDKLWDDKFVYIIRAIGAVGNKMGLTLDTFVQIAEELSTFI